ncbi:MAG: glycosyltransferase [Dissulfurispiraceae bacterium]|jgi:glycosyltransferase involved in cell wall biosynthesis
MAFIDCPEAELKRGLVEPYCENVFLFESAAVPPRQSLRRWFTVLFSPDSTTMRCSSRVFAEELRRKLVSRPPDVVQIDGYGMLQYRKHVKNVPCVAFPIDCETLSLEREKVSNVLLTARLAVHGVKVRRVESTYGSYYASVFVAQPDADRARQLSPDANIVCIPNGVDADYFSPTDQGVEPETIVFHGSMCFPPNIEAATWFITKVWPGLRDRHPKARYLVVGTDPAEQILAAALGDNRIVVTGSVPDVRPYLQSASVVAVPMQSGSGIKNKVLEGMAMAKPVVLSSMATAGINHAIPGQHFVTADTPEQFIDAICGLWRNPDRASRIGASARELVQTHHSWECMQDACESLLRNAAGRGWHSTKT